MADTVGPDPSAVSKFISTHSHVSPVVMINLLRFRDDADYDGDAHDPCSGRVAFSRYMEAVEPLIQRAGGTTVWSGNVLSPLLAGNGEDWDLVVLVSYPSTEAFQEMAVSDAYQAAVHHRRAALADYRLIPANPF